MTCRRGDADKLGQRAVGHPRIRVQGGENAPIDAIDLNGLNILRWPGRSSARSRQSFWHAPNISKSLRSDCHYTESSSHSM
jgi:hypothetical protein